ncbi:MAG TPA: hypothetical protein PK074_09310 [Spirochaetales bacterium]|nr:hypothetical protein [Spirochaetales bacterium]
MADQNDKLQGVYSKIEALTDELRSIFASLDPQIKSFEGLQKSFAAVIAENNDVKLRILTAHNTLDQIIDIYYAAESKIKDTVAELPVKLLRENGKPASESPKIHTSSISSGDIILEDWLAELLYK